MYGKHFESMYDGSMYGSGIAVFAVWGYVISHTREGRIELNSRKLADTLGGEVKEIEEAISFLERPDPESRQKAHGGRRLLKEGEFQYSVPSWEHYQRLKNEADRREYNREAKRRERARKKTKPLPGENAAIAAEERGDQKGADAVTTAALPEPTVPRGTITPTPADPAAEAPALGAGTAHPPPCNPDAGMPDPERSSSPEEEELTYPDGEPLG